MEILRLTMGVALIAAGFGLAFLWYHDMAGDSFRIMSLLPMVWIDELPGGLLLLSTIFLSVGRFLSSEPFLAFLVSGAFAVGALGFTLLMLLESTEDHPFNAPIPIEDLPGDPLVLIGICLGLGLVTYPWSKKQRS